MPGSTNNTTSLNMGGPEAYTGGTIGTRQFNDFTAREISSQISRDNLEKLMPSDERLSELRKSVIKMVTGWLPEDKIAVITEYGDSSLLKEFNKKGIPDKALNVICAESIITHLDPETLEQLAKDIAIKERKLEQKIDRANIAGEGSRKNQTKKLTYFNSSTFEEMFERGKTAYDTDELKKRLQDFDPTYTVPKDVEKQFPLLRKELYGVLTECYNKVELVGVAYSLGIEVKDGERDGQIKNAIINKVCLFAALITGKSAVNYGGAITDTEPYEDLLQYTSYSYLVGKPGFDRPMWNVLKMNARRAKVAMKERAKLQSKDKKFSGKFLYQATGGKKTRTLFGLKNSLKKEDTGILAGASYEKLAELAGRYGIDPTSFRNRNIYRLKALIYAGMANEAKEVDRLKRQRSKLVSKGKTTRDIDDRIAAYEQTTSATPGKQPFQKVPLVQFSKDGKVSNTHIMEAIPVYIVGQGGAGQIKATEEDENVKSELDKLRNQQRKERRKEKFKSIFKNINEYGLFASFGVKRDLDKFDISQSDEYEQKKQELLGKENENYSDEALNSRMPIPKIDWVESDNDIKTMKRITQVSPVFDVRLPTIRMFSANVPEKEEDFVKEYKLFRKHITKVVPTFITNMPMLDKEIVPLVDLKASFSANGEATYSATSFIAKAVPVFVVNNPKQQPEVEKADENEGKPEYTEGIGKNVDVASEYKTANGGESKGKNNIEFTKSFAQIAKDMFDKGYKPKSKYLQTAYDVIKNGPTQDVDKVEEYLAKFGKGKVGRKSGVLATDDLEWANQNNYKFAKGASFIAGDSHNGQPNPELITVKPLIKGSNNKYSKLSGKEKNRFSNNWKEGSNNALFGKIKENSKANKVADTLKLKKYINIPAIPVIQTAEDGSTKRIVDAIDSLKDEIVDNFGSLFTGLASDVVAAPFGAGVVTRPLLAVSGVKNKVVSIANKVAGTTLSTIQSALGMNTGGVIKAATGADISNGYNVITGDAPGNNIFNGGAKPELVRSNGNLSITPLNKTGTEKQQKVSRMTLNERKQALATAISSHVIKYNYSLPDGIEDVSNKGEAIKVFDVKPGLADKITVNGTSISVAELLANIYTQLAALNTTEQSNTSLLGELIKTNINNKTMVSTSSTSGSFTTALDTILSGN